MTECDNCERNNINTEYGYYQDEKIPNRYFCSWLCLVDYREKVKKNDK